MASVLLGYANAYLVLRTAVPPTLVNGRLTRAVGEECLVRCYLPRQQLSGVSSGADYLPSLTLSSDVLPGGSGEVYYYSGYGLRWAPAPGNYEQGLEPDDGDSSWQDLVPDVLPAWLYSGAEGLLIQGLEPGKPCVVERCTGRYGGAAIDGLIAANVGGVPLFIRAGQVTS